MPCRPLPQAEHDMVLELREQMALQSRMLGAGAGATHSGTGAAGAAAAAGDQADAEPVTAAALVRAARDGGGGGGGGGADPVVRRLLRLVCEGPLGRCVPRKDMVGGSN